MNDTLHRSAVRSRRTGRRARVAATIGCGLLAAGCSPKLFPENEAWRAPDEQLRRIAALRVDELSEPRPEPGRDVIERAMTGRLPLEDYPERVSVDLANVRAAALEGNLELRTALVDPEISAAQLDAERAKFESTLLANVSYLNSEQQITAAEQSSTSETTRMNLGFRVPLQTGGTIDVTTPLTRQTQDSLTSFTDAFWNAGLQFSISQPLLRGAGIELNTASIRIADWQDQITQARTKLVATRVLANAEKAYWRLYAAWRELEVRREQYDVAVDQLERSRRLAAEGQVAEVEVVRAESGIGSSLEAIIRADALVRRRVRELKQFMNREDLPVESPTAIEPTTVPSPVGLEFDRQALIDAAIANRMELLELELQLAIDETNIDSARNAALPLFVLDYAFGLNGVDEQSWTQAYSNAVSFDFPTVSAGVRAEIPLGNEAAKARVRESVLRRVQRLATRDQRRQSISVEVLAAVDSIEEAWQRILAARLETVLAGRTLEAERRQFELGLRTSIDVLEASARLADAQSAEISALVEYQAALVDMAFATGTLFGQGAVVWLDDAEGSRFRELADDIVRLDPEPTGG